MSDGGADRRPGRPEPRPLPRRFYEEASYESREEGFVIVLDGRPVRTPARAVLAVPNEPLAAEIASEWAGQEERIDPHAMPLTRLANSALDQVSGREREVVAEMVSYAATDLLCYRAGTPEGLVEAQQAHWDPVLEWARDALGATFVLGEGVNPVDQPADSIDRVRAALAAFDAFALAALHTMTTLTGSALLALAHARGALTAEETWRAAHVDEDWQIAVWGEDAEAMNRRAALRRDMEAASRLLSLLEG